MPTDAKRTLQLNDQGQLRHFLTLDGLPRELLTELLDTADSFLEVGARAVKKVPLLRGKTVCNVFFENSTRTRTTFELAAQRRRDHAERIDLVHQQGRNPVRHLAQSGSHGRRHVRSPPC